MPNALDTPAADDQESPAFRSDLGTETPELMGPQTNNEMDAVVRAVQTLQAIGNSLSPATQVGRELAGATAQPQPDPAQASYGRMMSGPLDPSEAGIPDLRFGQSRAPTGIDAGPGPVEARPDFLSAPPGGEAGEKALRPTRAEELANYEMTKVGSVEQEMKDAYVAHTAYQEALQAAKADHADKEARAHENAVTKQQLLNARTEREQAMIDAKVDADMAASMSRMSQLAKEEPNPARWWENQDGLGKALWAMSLVFSSAYVALTPGAKNTALEMVQGEIRRDVEAQMARNRREMAIEEMSATNIQRKGQRASDRLRSKYEREYATIMALERAWVARAAVPNDLDAAAMKQEGIAFLSGMRLQLAQQKRAEDVAAGRAQLQMKHDKEMLALRNAQEDKMFWWLDKQRRDLAELELSAKAGGPKYDAQGRMLNKEGVPLFSESTATGASGNIIVWDPKTKNPAVSPYNQQPGVAVFRDDAQRQKFDDTDRLGNERYDKRVRLLEKLRAKKGTELAVGTAIGEVDPEIESLILDLAFTDAKAVDGRVSDADLMNKIRQNVGFNPDGKGLDRLKYAFNYDKIANMVDADIKRMPKYMGEHLGSFLDRSIQGDAQVAWKPANLAIPEVKKRSQLDVEGKPAQDMSANPVSGVKDYKARAAQDTGAAEGQFLPSHDKNAITAALAAAEGRGPEGVAAEARRILSELDGEKQAFKAKFEDQSVYPGSPVTRPGTAQTQTQEDKDRLAYMENTETIVKSVLKDAEAKAAKTLKQFEQFANMPWVDEERMREEAVKRFNLGEAPREVNAIIKKALDSRVKDMSGLERTLYEGKKKLNESD